MTGLSGAILVTGGTGTLGHAIVRAAQAWDCSITIYSRSELKQAEMRARYPDLRYVLGDVRDYERLNAAVAGHDIVIHAAAMKHVDLGDQQPGECYAVNCGGSENVIRACIVQGVRRCIAISTDKVARAVTAYGATKLVMEKLFMTAPHNPTVFTATRYGNVIASNGSVLSVWRQMLARDGCVTATEPDMSRFWLTTDDAVRLIELASEQPAGTVIIPRLPALSMRTLRQYFLPDAEFRYAGLRTNEKRHEDLLTPEEAQSAELCADKRAPWGYYRLWPSARPDGGVREGYSSAAPSHTITREEFLEMIA